MCTKEEKEVTELLFCKQIIRILIASIIEFVTSNKKPRFDVLIKSQLLSDQKHLLNVSTIDFFFYIICLQNNIHSLLFLFSAYLLQV